MKPQNSRILLATLYMLIGIYLFTPIVAIAHEYSKLMNPISALQITQLMELPEPADHIVLNNEGHHFLDSNLRDKDKNHHQAHQDNSMTDDCCASMNHGMHNCCAIFQHLTLLTSSPYEIPPFKLLTPWDSYIMLLDNPPPQLTHS
ncbi:hypothetical protein WMO13_04900 [Ignatzschineria larvae DSM 13226]|uniref:DUF2946 domain-containing protein n=1 Tax=Ignatzschineria larvae DSM 13226 TaxID=1111732 RepID=A0ABZ3C2T6_9GAMM|nr:hypothetical protein [Ignatzschineria larvae]